MSVQRIKVFLGFVLLGPPIGLWALLVLLAIPAILADPSELLEVARIAVLGIPAAYFVGSIPASIAGAVAALALQSKFDHLGYIVVLGVLMGVASMFVLPVMFGTGEWPSSSSMPTSSAVEFVYLCTVATVACWFVGHWGERRAA